MSAHELYHSPLEGRYASLEMLQLFSDDTKFSTWRRLWLFLAQEEAALGIPITKVQLDELASHLTDINYEVAGEREKVIRHDVMAHVYAYGQQCPQAAPIIHLGATSCFVTDNTDLIIIRQALDLLTKKLLGVIKLLSDFADRYKDVVCLGSTHYQAAQLTTVGKRAALWLQDFVENLSELESVRAQMKLRGCKGTTGTQESFLKLFAGDEEKVKQLDQRLAVRFNFPAVYPVTGQTYPRNFDVLVLDCLAHLALSANKFATDLRLLQHDKEIEEPFNKKQVGSSAMAYKRNPMRCERICSLALYAVNQARNATDIALNQWLERTLNDSANRRLCLPECFLTLDAILLLVANISNGLVVNQAVIKKRLKAELPFMATEEILMRAVAHGGDRQKLHEQLRQHSQAAAKRVKQEGLDNDLLARLLGDPSFSLTKEELSQLLNPRRLCGRASQQVSEYLTQTVWPLLQARREHWAKIDTTVQV